MDMTLVKPFYKGNCGRRGDRDRDRNRENEKEMKTKKKNKEKRNA